MELAALNIICGHYGSGKTNLSLNLALYLARQGKEVTVVDLDVVNPYFRASDSRAMLEEKGIKVLGPSMAGSTLDVPFLPPEVGAVIRNGQCVIVDAGGDDSGATALGCYAQDVMSRPHDMLYVINCNRVLSRTAQEALELLYEIEGASHLKATALVNNSHVMDLTTAETVMQSVPFAQEVSRLSGLPVKFTAAREEIAGQLGVPDVFPIRRLVRTPWE